MKYPPRYILFLSLFFVCAYSSLIIAQTQKQSKRIDQSEVISENESLRNLSEKSEIIMIGKVTKQESAWNESKSYIYTNVTLQVDEYLKGNNNDSYIDVRYLGGEVGSIGELYSDIPKFNENEEVMLFLKKDSNRNSYRLSGGNESKINILNDELTKEKITSSRKPVNSLKAQIKKYINK